MTNCTSLHFIPTNDNNNRISSKIYTRENTKKYQHYTIYVHDSAYISDSNELFPNLKLNKASIYKYINSSQNTRKFIVRVVLWFNYLQNHEKHSVYTYRNNV